MNPLVSVLMPVWRPNSVHFEAALNSLNEQTYRDFEVVVVERESDSDSRNCVERILGDRVQLHHLGRATDIVEQLNYGLAQCRGSLIARFDADDECHRKRLETQVAYLQRHGEIGVLGSWLEIIDEQGKHLGLRRYPREHATILETFPFSNPFGHPSVMFRKDIVTGVGGYHRIELTTRPPVPWCQDYDLWSRLAQAGAKFANVDQTLLRYRVHSRQIKSDHVRDVLRATVAVKQRYWHSEMGSRAQLRLWAERFLQWMPSPVVVRLFLAIQGRSRKAPLTGRLSLRGRQFL